MRARRADGAPRFALSDGKRWRGDELPGIVRHVFTHFPLELSVYVAEHSGADAQRHRARAGSRFPQLGGEALPSLMRKVIGHALPSDLMR